MVTLPKTASQFDSVFLVDVTPAMAEEWLRANNAYNRPISPATAYRYCNQMLAGRWKRIHQGIAFDSRGSLIDGQHRLLAICMSRKTVKMLVFTNEHAENHDAVDGGKPRSNLEVVQIADNDWSLPNSVITTVKALVAGRYCKRPNLSSAEVYDFYLASRAGTDFTVKMFEPLKVAGHLNDPTIRGVVARAYYYVSKDALREFCYLFCSCTPHPLISPFRDWLFTLNNHRENTRREIYKRFEYTLMAYMRGESEVTIPAESRELFPVLED